MKAPFFLLALCSVAAAETITLNSIKDSDVYSFLDSTVGNPVTLNVNSSIGMAHSNHSLVQFNLAGFAIPATQIASAKLSFWSIAPNSSMGGSFRAGNVAIFRQGATWNETGMKWSHLKPMEQYAVMPVTTSGAWVHVDITALVTYWLNNPTQNFGLLMRPETENEEPGMNVEFFGREVGATYAPKLEITRGTPPVTTPPVLALAQSAGQIVIEWPVAGSTGWTLQETDDLTAPWTASTATPTETAGKWRVAHTPGTSPRRFFRLNKP